MVQRPSDDDAEQGKRQEADSEVRERETRDFEDAH